MTHKILIGLGVLAASAVAASSSAFAAGAGSSARAHMYVPIKSLAKTVALSPKGVRRSLRDRGYRNIHFTDRHLPVYKVRACRNGKRYSLRLNRWGRIMDRDRRGWCGYGRYYRGKYYGPRNRAGLYYDGPGFSITLRNGRRY
ncbi:MAG: hypothetical protein GY927_05890 [bacterium]|nr:hypothetical protein [bacterium]